MAGKKERHETVMAQRLALDSEGNARVTRNDTRVVPRLVWMRLFTLVV